MSQVKDSEANPSMQVYSPLSPLANKVPPSNGVLLITQRQDRLTLQHNCNYSYSLIPKLALACQMMLFKLDIAIKWLVTSSEQ